MVKKYCSLKGFELILIYHKYPFYFDYTIWYNYALCGIKMDMVQH